jgi:hypothetical protein
MFLAYDPHGTPVFECQICGECVDARDEMLDLEGGDCEERPDDMHG